jgi:F0F1-type ATP synthase epsilon subunit
MELTLIGPTSSQTLAINWLEVATQEGNFVVLPGHTPMILLLAPNKELTMERTDGATMVMTIAGGFLEVTRTSILLILTHD